MKTLPTSPARWAGIVLLLAPLATAHALSETTERSFDLPAGGRVELLADRGSVEIATGGSPRVTMTVVRDVKRLSDSAAREVLDAHRLEFEQDADRILVRAGFPGVTSGWSRKASGFSVKYQVTVPARCDLKVHTAGGNITVADLAGSLELRTAGGSIGTGVIDGPVRADTAGGSIRIGGATGRVDAGTAGGSIHLGRIAGAVDAHTAGGTITVESSSGPLKARTSGGSIRIEGAAGSVDAETAGGSIHVRFTGAPTSDSTLETVGGGVRVQLPADAAVNLDAQTFGGGVKSDLPVDSKDKPSRDRLRGTIRGGGPLLKLRTSGGGITVEPAGTVR